MNRLKLTYVITGLEAGGAETVIYKLLSRHDRERFHPTLISLMSCEGLPLHQKIRALGVDVYSLGLRPGRPTPGAFVRLWRFLRRLQPDVISGWEVHGDVAVTCASYLYSRPAMIWNVCGSLDDLTTEKPATRALIHALAHVSHRPLRIIYNSRVSARQHEAIGYQASRTSIIPNGFDCDLFRPDEAARVAIRGELSLRPEDSLVGLVARYHPVKDHATFLQAAARVAKSDRNVHFVLVGRGVDHSNGALVSLIRELGLQDRVALLGERHDIPRINAALDVACLSSAAEAFPNVMGEAMACGVPCVATAVGDVAWVLGNAGRVMPRRNPGAFALALGDLLRMPVERRRELGVLARQRILDNCDLDKVARVFDDLHLSVAEQAAGSARVRFRGVEQREVA